MEPKASHWLMALIGALAVHLSLLTLFERPAQPVTPVRGILIDLGNGTDPGEDSSKPESLLPSGAENLPEAEPVALETMESDEASDVQPEELQPVEPEPSEDLVAVTEALPVPIVAEPSAPAKPERTISPKAKPKKQKKARSPKIKKKPPKTRRDKKFAKVSARKAAGGGGKSEAGEGNRKQGSGTGSGASAAAAKSRYAGQISAWLNRNKRYPKQARRRRHQGSVTVRFTVDREGRVLSSSIVRSSGHAALDDEVRALMHRGRMPRMPAAMQQSRMTMAVPIRFQLR